MDEEDVAWLKIMNDKRKSKIKLIIKYRYRTHRLRTNSLTRFTTSDFFVK
jgi:hypothetical protein